MTEKKVVKMQYTNLGGTGCRVSKICLGCMSYGTKKWQPWVLEEEESLQLIKKAYDQGINFFDTADVYSSGESERIFGKAIKQFNFQRTKIVVATKVFFNFIDGEPERNFFGKNAEEFGLINQGGLSRKHIFEAVEGSLKRLQLDYIDLYQIHRFDPQTPVEETMRALNDLVLLGKVRYIGASSMWAWQFQKMQNVAKQHGWAQFVTMQNLYNLIYREEEREMIPYSLDANVGLIPWGPIAAGRLARPPSVTEEKQTERAAADTVYPPLTDVDKTIINRVHEVAKKLNATASQVSVAWLLTKPVVSAPILGISSEERLIDLIGALEVKLSPEDIKYLEEPYVPKPVRGHQ